MADQVTQKETIRICSCGPKDKALKKRLLCIYVQWYFTVQ
jgi:hypothetical protein